VFDKAKIAKGLEKVSVQADRVYALNKMIAGQSSWRIEKGKQPRRVSE
jgi:hypothetical protein